MSPESGTDLCEEFWLGSPEVVVKMPAKAAVSKGLMGLEVLLPGCLSTGAGCWGKALGPLQGDLSMRPELPDNVIILGSKSELLETKRARQKLHPLL